MQGHAVRSTSPPLQPSQQAIDSVWGRSKFVHFVSKANVQFGNDRTTFGFGTFCLFVRRPVIPNNRPGIPLHGCNPSRACVCFAYPCGEFRSFAVRS
jgi:hypothetical protein